VSRLRWRLGLVSSLTCVSFRDYLRPDLRSCATGSREQLRGVLKEVLGLPRT